MLVVRLVWGIVLARLVEGILLLRFDVFLFIYYWILVGVKILE